MVKPSEKLKRILLLMGITGAVYGGFRYLLPLVIPFLCAYGTVLLLRPFLRFLEYRFCKWRRRGLFVALVGGAELFLLLGVIFGALLWGGRLLGGQLIRFTARAPIWLSRADRWLTEGCRFLEKKLGLRADYLVELCGDMVGELGQLFKESTMPLLMNTSVPLFKVAAGAVIFFVLYFAAVIFSLQEMEDIRERKARSVFHREFQLIGRRLSSVVSAWLKAQLAILALTSLLCIAGLAWIGNPYSALLGVGIGLLDALPLFGAGTVLVPWGILLLLGRRWGDAAVILGLYVVCYFLREILEAKLMGNQVGLSPLESLVSMYVGLQLFGIPGFLLGPLGLLMIEDLFALYGSDGS